MTEREAWEDTARQKGATRLINARRVPESEYDGWVCSEQVDGWRDGYFESVDGLREYCRDEDVPLPAEVWACKPIPFRLMSADEMVEFACENGDYREDIADWLTDTSELQAAIDAWVAKQTAVSYEPDYRTRVVLAREAEG